MGLKAEINNENRVIFEALYINQDVYREARFPNESGILTPRIISRPPSKYTWLELKPLSSISDEDAEFIDLQSEDYNEDGWFDDGEFYWWASIDVDYLRSKGYALPFMELSVEEMVEAGWIKLKEK
jgi:hypothetical protein